MQVFIVEHSYGNPIRVVNHWVFRHRSKARKFCERRNVKEYGEYSRKCGPFHILRRRTLRGY